MADFENITGWYEEFSEWAKTDEYKNFFHRRQERRSRIPEVKLPLSLVYDFVEFAMKQAEILGYADVINAWKKLDDGRGNPEDSDDFPAMQNEMISTFGIWYLWKHGDLRPNFPPFIQRIRRLIFGLMRPVFANPFSWRTRWG